MLKKDWDQKSNLRGRAVPDFLVAGLLAAISRGVKDGGASGG